MSISKEEQKKHIVEMMHKDEELGLYDDRKKEMDDLRKLAESRWEGCHGCDENDKGFWINGFMIGYLNARVDNVDDRIEAARGKIADILINNCHYSGLPSINSYEEKQ
jgi:hypothetical protein